MEFMTTPATLVAGSSLEDTKRRFEEAQARKRKKVCEPGFIAAWKKRKDKANSEPKTRNISNTGSWEMHKNPSISIVNAIPFPAVSETQVDRTYVGSGNGGNGGGPVMVMSALNYAEN